MTEYCPNGCGDLVILERPKPINEFLTTEVIEVLLWLQERDKEWAARVEENVKNTTVKAICPECSFVRCGPMESEEG